MNSLETEGRIRVVVMDRKDATHLIGDGNSKCKKQKRGNDGEKVISRSLLSPQLRMYGFTKFW